MVKSRSFGVHWSVYHRQCIIRQRSFQAERPLVLSINASYFGMDKIMFPVQLYIANYIVILSN